MDHLEKETEDSFKALLGKRVEVICKGERYCGILQFAGKNRFIHHHFHVTISRMPLWPVDRDSIKEL